MLANLHFSHHDRVVVAEVVGEVDMSNADEIGTALVQSLSNEALALVVDLSGVDYFDSAGIHLVYDLRTRLGVRGQKLAMVVPPGSTVRDTLELSAVLGSLGVDETLDAAIGRVSA
jgi:anti-sigma B factor antagonist